MIVVLPDTGAQILAKLLPVDGPSSGLDADKLDGNDSAYFLAASAVSAYGATLIDDTDAATARATLGLGTIATATETNYLLANGTRTGASSQAQTFTNGIVGPSWKPASNSTTALQLQNAGGTAILTVDTTNSRVGIGTTPSYVFHTQLPETPATSIGAQIANNGGTELITNTTDRDFSGAGNWTGTNWAVSGGVLVHTAGSTANATLTNANLTASSIINGRYYRLVYTISGMTTGSLTPKLGSVSLTAQSANGTYTDYVVAGADNVDLIFTPASAFDGSIDNVSLQRVASIFTMLNNGKAGFGTNNPSTMLEVIDPTNTPFNVVRRSTATATSNGGFNAVHETTQTAADGFGVHQSFRIKDSTNLATTIGTLGAVRDTALNSGAMVIRCTSAGTVTERARWSNLGIYTQSAGGSETSTVVNVMLVKKTSSATPAAGFGAGIDFQLKSSTTADQDAAVIEALWQTATHASRAADMVFSAYNVTTKREFLRGRGGSSNAQIGFLGATPASQQTGGAATASGTYGVTEQTMLQRAYDCLRTFGLLS